MDHSAACSPGSGSGAYSGAAPCQRSLSQLIDIPAAQLHELKLQLAEVSAYSAVMLPPIDLEYEFNR